MLTAAGADAAELVACFLEGLDVAATGADAADETDFSEGLEGLEGAEAIGSELLLGSLVGIWLDTATRPWPPAG